MAEFKSCDYCGEVLFLGSKIYEHKGLNICEDCSGKYAWMLFEQEAKIKIVECAELVITDDIDLDTFR